MRQISAGVCVLGLLVAFVLAPIVLPGTRFRTVIGDLAPLLVITATAVLAFRNMLDSRGPTRLFWGLISLSMIMWWFNQVCWTWFEVWARKPLPDPFIGDVVLFLHVVPIMAAVSIRPQDGVDGEGMLSSMLNVLMLAVWWVVLYAFVVFPDEYVVMNVVVYNRSWDVLYLVEGMILIALSGWAFAHTQGSWRSLYLNMFLASVAYSFASEAMNAAIARGTYQTGGIWDLPFLVSLLSFFWMVLSGRESLRELQAESPAKRAESVLAPHLAKLALLSLPCMGYWALYVSDAPARLRQVRFEVAIGGTAALAFFVFFKQHLLDRRLVQLLKESRRSYADLQRLQGRVIQQAKLASLGELVALASSELQHPLSTILESSEALAASSHLKSEQLSAARRIGQQARRTRDLVDDLLSFAQQMPGEKAPLELKPLVQRALQMEGFKVENRGISLLVQSEDPLPRVLGNANQLLQAFVQIVENAVDALQEAGGGRLLVSLRREDKDVVIEFADTGPGLQNPERVFDPFYTTKPVGKGTGLGLSATYGVIRDHAGQISCHNRPEGGAIFEIRLPMFKAGVFAPAVVRV